MVTAGIQPVVVKICGVKDVATALHAAAAGADAIGLVFYAQSPRVVDVDTAGKIVAALPANVSAVALFVNEQADTIRRIIEDVNPAILQFHGDEPAEFCEQFGKPYWKAIRVNATTDLLNCEQSFASATRLLLDTDKSAAGGAGSVMYGGTGAAFDWNLIPQQMRSRIILSGGLNGANVASAIRTVRPWGVDVSSGVEESKGVKSHSLISHFMNEVLRANV